MVYQFMFNVGSFFNCQEGILVIKVNGDVVIVEQFESVWCVSLLFVDEFGSVFVDDVKVYLVLQVIDWGVVFSGLKDVQVSCVDVNVEVQKVCEFNKFIDNKVWIDVL